MKRFLIDTDVIIDHLRGEEKARNYLRQIKSEHSDVLYSVITKAELLLGSATQGREKDGQVAEQHGRNPHRW